MANGLDITCIVGTFSGDNLSFNSAEVVISGSASAALGGAVFDSASGLFIIAYRRSSGSSSTYIAARKVDCSGVNISVGSENILRSTGGIDTSSTVTKPVKLNNGDFYAVAYWDSNTEDSLYTAVMSVLGGSIVVNDNELIIDPVSTGGWSIPDLVPVTSTKYIIIATFNSSIFEYLVDFNGTSITSIESLSLSGNGNFYVSNSVGSYYNSNSDFVELYDFTSNQNLGQHDFSQFNSSMPYINLNAKTNPTYDNVLTCTNGITIIPSSTSYKAVIVTGNDKLVTPTSYGIVDQAVTSGQTYKFPVRLAKQGGKPITLTGSGIKPCESLYGSGETLRLGASSTNTFDSEYIGYCLTDDVLIINSSSSKET
jgi:hypothetical protein